MNNSRWGVFASFLRRAQLVLALSAGLSSTAAAQIPSREFVLRLTGTHLRAREVDSLRAVIRRTPGILQALIELAEDSSEASLNRKNAMVSVGYLGTPQAFGVLTRVAESSPDADLKNAALVGLAMFGDSPPVLAVLERFLGSESERDRQAAALALLVIAVRERSQAIVPIIRRALLTERALGVRQDLERALRELGLGP